MEVIAMKLRCRIWGTNIYPAYVFEKIAKAFGKYGVIYGDGFIDLEKGVSEESISLIVEYLSTFKLNFDAGFREIIEEQDIKNARYVRLAINGTYDVDDDENGVPLNSYTALLCDKCLWHDDESLPNPYLVNAKYLRKRQNVYSGGCGIVVVTEKIKRVFEDYCIDEVSIGPAEPTGEGKAVPDKRLFWIKPKHAIYSNPDAILVSKCEQCGRPVEMRMDYKKGRKTMGYCSVVIEKNIYHIDSPEDYHIITETNWSGRRTKERPMGYIKRIYLSSDFYYTLEKLKANGIVEPDILLV